MNLLEPIAPLIKPPRGWFQHSGLPHYDGGPIPQAVTFRLAGALPSELTTAWRDELRLLPPVQAAQELRLRAEEHLDRGTGPTWLAMPEIAKLVEDALLFFHRQRYELEAWAVMPNHVHVVLVPFLGRALGAILRSWKGYTAAIANRILGRSGAFWQADYFDQFLRGRRHLGATVQYVEYNPVKAGLCATPEDWPWSSARRRSAAGAGQA